jgi:hypothetical protein
VILSGIREGRISVRERTVIKRINSIEIIVSSTIIPRGFPSGRGGDCFSVKYQKKKGKSMEAKLVRICGLVGLLLIVSLLIFGCGKEQAPPPAQTPPPAAAPAPAPPAAATPAAPSPSAPGGTAQPSAAGPSQDAGQIQVGMSGEYVKKIMGEPGQVEQKGAVVEWKYMTPKGKAEIKLQDNKVTQVERH